MNTEHNEKHPSLLGQRRPTRGRLLRLGQITLLCCLVAQTYTLFPNLTRLSQKDIRATSSEPTKEWRDDVWPIRELTPWDISTDFAYPRKFSVDVDEGTWLRLDVHPSSGEIIFDMLGDIYCLPASAYLNPRFGYNERARPVLLGVPYDSDPHFSPDGSKFVFRSDAELGVENIWVSNWKGCDNMDLRSGDSEISRELSDALLWQKHEEELLNSGIKESTERKYRRLLREGRADAWRVTNETYRWVTDARFHPTEPKVVATKWYTSSRSLGAGEGWEFNLTEKGETITAGSGKRLVGRSLPLGWSTEDYGNQQVGPEQLLWKNEDTVIYSKNVADTNGQFEYDKDVHSGIYAIFETNLTSKRTTTLVSSSPGGATRPELSRDKKTLAFVRRVRDKEALVLKDLNSGTIRNIWYGLSYDLGGISAPMGTYPSFSFTPDDKAIIIWAAGKIWNVPLSTNTLGEKVLGGEPQIIPFTAHIEKSLAETRSSETDILSLESDETQRLHAFVELTINDNGTRVAFQGAGVSYYLDFDPTTSSTRVSPQKVPVLFPSQPYYSPSFVPGNSNFLIHARWSDTSFTTFELADLSSGNSYEISGLPQGRYIYPVLCSCQGNRRQIAFIKIGGDYLSGSIIATADPGLYLAEITLPETLVNDNQSIQLQNLRRLNSEISPGEQVSLKFLEGNKKLLVQESDRAFVIDLAGGADALGDYNHTTIAEGRMTREVTATPQQDKIAFVDAYNVFVVDKENIGDTPLWSKPGNATKGIARVSLDGGHDIAWSTSGERIFWFLGPYLHSLEVSRLSDCASDIRSDGVRFGIDCIKNLLDVQEVEASYETDITRLKNEASASALSRGASSQDSETYVIRNATILTMSSGSLDDDFYASSTLTIKGGIIDSISPVDQAYIPEGAIVLDAEGGYVIPGFIDGHAHWNGYDTLLPARSWELEAFLAYGVTTMHNPSSSNVRGFVERARVENGQIVGPRIFHTGEIIYGAGAGEYHNDVADVADARSALLRIRLEGGTASFSYKNYNQYSRASRQRLLLQARNLSMLCVPEGGMNEDWDMTYIIDGMTTIEHNLPIPVVYEDVMSLYAFSGTGATPTHIVDYGGTMGEQYLWANFDIANDPKLRRFVRHDILEGIIETTSRPKDSFQLFNVSASIAAMVHKGLRAHVGAHGEPPLGRMYHAELAFFAAGGLSNYETLRAATRDPAITLGLYNAIGSLEKGKLADLIAYHPDADLLDGDISESLKIKNVMRGGRIWDAETLVEEWPVKGRRPAMPILNAD